MNCASPVLHRFARKAELPAMFRAMDWNSSPLGPPDRWSAPLRTTVEVLMNASFPMFVAWGAELRMLYNDAHAPLAGAQHPAAFGQPLQTVWGDAWPRVQPVVAQALAGESCEVKDFAVDLLRGDEVKRGWFSFSFSPVLESSGEVGGVLCLVTDTTEAVLKERREGFRRELLEHLRGLTCPGAIATAALRLLGQHIGAARVFYAHVDDGDHTVGIRRDWTDGARDSLCGQTGSFAGLSANLLAAARHGATLAVNDLVADVRMEEGTQPLSLLGGGALLAVPLVKDGRWVAALGVQRATPGAWSRGDICLTEDTAQHTWAALERAEAEIALRAQVEAEVKRLQQLFALAPGAIAVMVGPHHVFEQANEAFYQLVGRRDLLGKPLRMALPDLVGQGFEVLLTEVHATGEPFVGRGLKACMRMSPDTPQVEKYVDLLYLPMCSPAGQVIGIFCQANDVTEAVRAQAELRKSDRRKDDFLATLAHELRNPLAPVRTAVHILEQGALSEEQRGSCHAIIARQSRNMALLLDDLLDVSRISKGRLELRREPVALASVLECAIEAARPLIDLKRHALKLTVPPESIRLDADPLRLAQVLTNLLSNAAKYTDPGGRIELTVQRGPDGVRIAVSDNGIGIEPGALPNIFQMFSQVKSAIDRSEGGLGIGLSLAKGLVDLHGADIYASSDGHGKGAVVTVHLPRAMVLASGATDAPHGPAAGAAAASRTVLVVDDNIDAAETLAMLLRMDGHEVVTAYSGPEALSICAGNAVDVAVLDVGMPEMTGYELATRIRQAPWGNAMLLVAVTGWGQESDKAQARSAGFDHHYTKPVDPGEILDVLAGLPGKSSCNRAETG